MLMQMLFLNFEESVTENVRGKHKHYKDRRETPDRHRSVTCFTARTH